MELYKRFPLTVETVEARIRKLVRVIRAFQGKGSQWHFYRKYHGCPNVTFFFKASRGESLSGTVVSHWANKSRHEQRHALFFLSRILGKKPTTVCSNFSTWFSTRERVETKRWISESVGRGWLRYCQKQLKKLHTRHVHGYLFCRNEGGTRERVNVGIRNDHATFYVCQTALYLIFERATIGHGTRLFIWLNRL